MPNLWPSTHWTAVARAGGDGPDRNDHLSRLIEQYMPVLRWHLRQTFQISAEDADDILQEFLLSNVLRNELFARADPERGRLRDLLRRSVDNVARNVLRRRKTGSVAPTDELNDRALTIDQPAGATFEVSWMRQVLGRAVRQMRSECQQRERPDIWGVFRGRILRPCLSRSDPAGYDKLVKQFNFKSPAQASNVLITSNRIFGRILREVIGAYEADKARIEEELVDLWKCAARAGSRRK